MKKYKLLIILIIINLLSLNVVNADECAFADIEIGGDISKAIEIYGEPIEIVNAEEDEDTTYDSYIEMDFTTICPGSGIEDGEVEIIIAGDYIAGFIISAYTRIEDPNIKEKLIYYYVKENYLSFTKEIESSDWIGRAHWDANEKEFYYNKKLIRKKKINEKLLITNEEMGRAF